MLHRYCNQRGVIESVIKIRRASENMMTIPQQCSYKEEKKLLKKLYRLFFIYSRYYYID